MASPTDRLDVVTDYIFDLLTTNKVTLGLQDVFYGDQTKIPRTPAACVFGSEKSRELQGAPRRVLNTLEVYVHLYHFKVTDTATNAIEADDRSEDVEALIHQDPTFGGLGFHGWVPRNEAGYLNRNNSMFRGNRLMVVLQSKTMLPMSPGYNQP